MDRLARLLEHLGLDLDPARVTITGADPVLPSSYPLGESAAAVLAALGLALARLGGPPQDVTVDVRHAGALLRGFLDQRRDGEVLDPDPTGRLPAVGLFRTRDDRWVQTYGAFPPLRGRTLGVLRLPDIEGLGRETIAAAIGRWDAQPLVDALLAAGAPAATVETAAAWEAGEPGRLLRATPVVAVERIGDAPDARVVANPLRRPLHGIRVLDLTRIVAGPTCGRTLAEHGAEVLAVSSPRLHAVGRALVETGPGRRHAELDLSDGDDRVRLDGLIRGADVFCQSARPGSFARRGLGPEELAQLRPGIVYASVDGYGSTGPWATRPGFEPLAQASTGWAVDHADADGTPRIVAALPCDHLTGFLTALGIAVALHRRATEGGSWHVRTSLARTAMWLRDEPGRHDPAAAIDLGAAATADLRDGISGAYGTIEQLRPSPWLSRTPPRWDRAAVPPGADPPAWLPDRTAAPP